MKLKEFHIIGVTNLWRVCKNHWWQAAIFQKFKNVIWSNARVSNVV